LEGDGIRGPEHYLYDANGNIIQMPHLPMMRWDFMDRLVSSARQVVNSGASEITFYQYDSAGQRVRKVNERRSGTRKTERLYVGGFEVFREYDVDGDSIEFQRETLHVMDDKQRIALVETLTRERGNSLRMPEPVQRYQLANHLGSATLELDEAALLISYEEYAPYGNTVYQAGRHGAEVRRKRYRYTGKERDDENGFTYHGARYYAPWLGRWTSCDPAKLEDSLNAYEYTLDNPVRLTDPNGRQAADDKVVSLSRWAQEGRWTGVWPPGVPSTGPIASQLAQAFSAADARRNTGLQPILLTSIPGWSGTWASLGPLTGLSNGQYTGLASGVGVQQVFEGGIAAAIHFDVTGVQVLGSGQTAGELRNVITTLQTGGNQNVDVHIYEDGQVSTILRGSTQVTGAPLPARIAERLPNLTPPEPPSGPTSPPAAGDSPPPGPPSLPSGDGFGGSGPAPTVSPSAGIAAANMTRALVPGVSELESSLQGASNLAYQYGAPTVGTALATASQAVPVAGAGLAAGGIAGTVTEAALVKAGADKDVAAAAGLSAAVFAGARLGAVVGAPFEGVGAVPGAIIGGIAGAIGFALFRNQ
jgi:RHS repeat-associated protein